MSRRLKVGAVVAAAVAGLTLTWFLVRRHPAPPGFITSCYAIDDVRAVVLIRANPKHGPSRGWVTLVDRNRGMVWRRELAGLPLVARFDGISLATESVSVRTSPGITSDNHQVTEKWSLHDGHRRSVDPLRRTPVHGRLAPGGTGRHAARAHLQQRRHHHRGTRSDPGMAGAMSGGPARRIP